MADLKNLEALREKVSLDALAFIQPSQEFLARPVAQPALALPAFGGQGRGRLRARPRQRQADQRRHRLVRRRCPPAQGSQAQVARRRRWQAQEARQEGKGPERPQAPRHLLHPLPKRLPAEHEGEEPGSEQHRAPPLHLRDLEVPARAGKVGAHAHIHEPPLDLTRLRFAELRGQGGEAQARLRGCRQRVRWRERQARRGARSSLQAHTLVSLTHPQPPKGVKKPTPVAKPASVAKPVDSDEEESGSEEEAPAPKPVAPKSSATKPTAPKVSAKPASKAKAKPAAVVEDSEEEDESSDDEPPAKKAPASKKQAQRQEESSGDEDSEEDEIEQPPPPSKRGKKGK